MSLVDFKELLIVNTHRRGINYKQFEPSFKKPVTLRFLLKKKKRALLYNAGNKNSKCHTEVRGFKEDLYPLVKKGLDTSP